MRIIVSQAQERVAQNAVTRDRPLGNTFPVRVRLPAVVYHGNPNKTVHFSSGRNAVVPTKPSRETILGCCIRAVSVRLTVDRPTADSGVAPDTVFFVRALPTGPVSPYYVYLGRRSTGGGRVCRAKTSQR